MAMLTVNDLNPQMIDDLSGQYSTMLQPAEDPSFDATRQQMFAQNAAMQNNEIPSNNMLPMLNQSMIPDSVNPILSNQPDSFLGAIAQGIKAPEGQTPFGDYVGANWQGLLQSGIAGLEDNYNRANLPADVYIKLKTQENEKVIAEQDRLLKNLQMQADVDYQRQSLELKREELAMERQKVLSGGDSPSAVKEYQFYSGLDPEAQKQYLGVKRAQQVIDYGAGFGILGQNGQVIPIQDKQLAPEQRPETKSAQAQAAEEGKILGEASGKLNSIEASLPTLENVTQRLSKLGKIATYTTAGQVRDSALRELGMDIPDAAVARTEYISTVDNEVLPLLRQTFGAAFTASEGERLRVTLGDPNKTPEEKDAVLRSFLAAKKGEVDTLRRQTGAAPAPTVAPTTRLKFNPATGDFE